MENDNKTAADPHEEVRKLKEQVKALELQLSQRSTLPSNGTSDAACVSQTAEVVLDCDVVTLDEVDLANGKQWLLSSEAEAHTGHSDDDVIWALRRRGQHQDRKAVLNEELTLAELVEQDRRKGIDTRTFTRPKKRMARPSLEVLESFARLSNTGEPALPRAVESIEGELLSDMTCSLLDSSLINSLTFYELAPDIETSSPVSFPNKKQKVIPSFHVSKFSDDPIKEFGKTFKKSSSPKYAPQSNTMSNLIEENMETSSPSLESMDISLGLVDSQDFSGDLIDSTYWNPKPNLNEAKNIKCDVNTTYIQDNSNESSACENLSECTAIRVEAKTPIIKSVLNATFIAPSSTISTAPPSSTVALPTNSILTPPANGMGVHRAGPPVTRAGSTDSGADDDQLSSTSDSSHNSATRLMSVGDVQNIARLQEESLVQSTPLHRRFRRFGNSSGTISPIPAEEHYGYGSDHSHSSRSPTSSLHSSPAGSPFGSSTALPTSQSPVKSKVATHPPPLHAESYRRSSIRPPGIRPPSNRPAGLRPPSIRPSGVRPPMAPGILSGLPRPAGTGIPRPASGANSRIPPPKIRPPSAHLTKKAWTDECF